jgi:hypothetical protein
MNKSWQEFIDDLITDGKATEHPDGMVTLNSQNTLVRIDELYAFVSSDETGEGVVAGPLFGPGSLAPLIAADKDRLRSLIPFAEYIAVTRKIKIKLIRLTTREEITEINGAD